MEKCDNNNNRSKDELLCHSTRPYRSVGQDKRRPRRRKTFQNSPDPRFFCVMITAYILTACSLFVAMIEILVPTGMLINNLIFLDATGSTGLWHAANFVPSGLLLLLALIKNDSNLMFSWMVIKMLWAMFCCLVGAILGGLFLGAFFTKDYSSPILQQLDTYELLTVTVEAVFSIFAVIIVYFHVSHLNGRKRSKNFSKDSVSMMEINNVTDKSLVNENYYYDL